MLLFLNISCTFLIIIIIREGNTQTMKANTTTPNHQQHRIYKVSYCIHSIPTFLSFYSDIDFPLPFYLFRNRPTKLALYLPCNPVIMIIEKKEININIKKIKIISKNSIIQKKNEK